jgi:site-specific DNA-cytosine methylase
MKLLELFKGTGSVSKALSKQYPNLQVWSLDIEAKSNATYTADIMNWDYKQFEEGCFDYIWASPPCTEYSVCLTTRPRRFDIADPIVLRVLDIIEYLKPKHWFIENPQTGHLKSRSFMSNIPYYDVSYCMYGNPIRKQTRIWTNLQDFSPLVCCKNCPQITEHGKHDAKHRDNNKHLRMIIPQDLIIDLFKCAEEE